MPAQIPTSSDPGFEIGTPTSPQGLLLVGESYDSDFEYLQFDGTTCAEIPVDFTGFTFAAEILDATGAIIDTFTITPAVGDATGIFKLQLTPTQVDASLETNAVKWQFRIFDAGPVVNNVLILAPFQVSSP